MAIEDVPNGTFLDAPCPVRAYPARKYESSRLDATHGVGVNVYAIPLSTKIAAKADELSTTNTRAADFGILKWAVPLIWSNSGHSQNGGTEISANND